MDWLAVVIWAIAAGYVTAGILSSFYQWIAAKPLSFRLLVSDELRASVIAVPLLALSGPAVLARNAWRGRIIEERAWGWIALSVAIIAGWSFVTGIAVLEALFSFRGFFD